MDKLTQNCYLYQLKTHQTNHW